MHFLLRSPTSKRVLTWLDHIQKPVVYIVCAKEVQDLKILVFKNNLPRVKPGNREGGPGFYCDG
jgi:hypothetical protein